MSPIHDDSLDYSKRDAVDPKDRVIEIAKKLVAIVDKHDWVLDDVGGEFKWKFEELEKAVKALDP